MTYIPPIRTDWIELPQITPPPQNSRSSKHITTTPSNHLKHSEFMKRVLPSGTSFSTELSTEDSLDEEYSRSSRSYEDRDPPIYDRPVINRNQSKPWRSKPSPFSDERGPPGTSYYKWRNVTYSRVTASPFVTDSVDYTILNPDIMQFEGDMSADTYPKTVIIKSKTPLASFGQDNKFNRVGFNSKLDTTTMPDNLNADYSGPIYEDSVGEYDNPEAGTLLKVFFFTPYNKLSLFF